MATASGNESSPRVFISYARVDGETHAKYLHDRLTGEGLRCWWDREDLRRTASWWRKIDQALDFVEFVVVVLTPGVLESETCGKEWQWARRKGKFIVGIKAGMPFDDPRVPRWLKRSHVYQAIDQKSGSFNAGIEWRKFVNDLNTTPAVEKVPFMVADLPEDFVARPEEYDKLLEVLVDTNQTAPLAITAALRGAGGYGKTTLAKALCHDLRVQEAFDDGILWVTLGEKAENLTGRIRDCIQALSGTRPDFTSEREASSRLAELLEGRHLLIVIDDVWKQSHLQPFLEGGRDCAHLITTRISDVLPKSAQKLNVDAMKPEEASALLAAGLAQAEERAIAELADKLGEWPLLLKLVNRVIYRRVEKGEPVSKAIGYVSEKLKRQGLAAFDARDADQRDDAIGKTLKVSFEFLEPNTELPRLFELGIFPEDEDIPLDTIGSLWRLTGDLDEVKSEELCERFLGLSLILELDLGDRSLRLHDAIRKYYHSQLVDSRVVHDRLIDSWKDPYALPNRYSWKWYGWHVSKSSDPERLHAQLTDFTWLHAKLKATDVNSLFREFGHEGLTKTESLRLIENAISLSAHVLIKNKTQLASQLLGRLQRSSSVEIDGVRSKASAYYERTWLEPLKSSLQTAGGSLVGILAGHSDLVDAVTVTPDGHHAVSGSWDKTVKVWDLKTNELVRTLEGHSGQVSAVAVTPDGHHAVSGSSDKTVKVWDLKTGEVVRTLEGHSDSVRAVAVTPDGHHAVSGSYDNTVKVWDLKTGELVRTLEGHSDSVTAVAVTPDGHHAVSGSWDKTVKVWDLKTGEVVRTLEGHSDSVTAVTVTPDGHHAVSGSSDRQVNLWELETYQLITSFFADWSIMTVSVAGSGAVIAGDSGGRLHFLKIRLHEGNQGREKGT